MIDLMHGPQYAKKYVSDYLERDMPIRLVAYRNGWNVDDVTLPTPVKYLSYEPIALDDWPTIITVVMSTNKFERIDFDHHDPVYRVTYSMRTYVWVRTEYSDECTTMRDRHTVVVRSALLDYPCMQATDPRESWMARIDETSIREEFSDLTLLKGDRVLAGAFIGYDLTIDEVVARETLGTVSIIDLDIKQNPISPSASITYNP
jgi:hypothetical protein